MGEEGGGGGSFSLMCTRVTGALVFFLFSAGQGWSVIGKLHPENQYQYFSEFQERESQNSDIGATITTNPQRQASGRVATLVYVAA